MPSMMMRDRHLALMANRRLFMQIFRVDMMKFYDDAWLGFDVVGFDDWLRDNVEAYDEDKESMKAFVQRRYGNEGLKLIAEIIGENLETANADGGTGPNSGG